ncbi:hypothetical protein K503DRAFT_743176 [Rhizopogon vinicolor AM-OR11-026]|uniref:Uncharacterized protein n=1 Tax=Rhizopogon vinicolor AM-OR11-026 TaxID=1314800 RepID=A0A1B7MX26_9AGAM|nr:hypothetical protein K503DRAFT_743176 [Rhizopogon vinicolor AM-OR11-026]
MDYDVASVPPMSLPALDALQNLPTDFTSALDTLQRQNIIDTFSRVDFLTKGTIQPKLSQFKCFVSLLASSQVVVKAATDASKTLATMLPLFLSPNKMAITVMPLKLRTIVTLQVNEFLQFGISSIAINHDSPHDKTLWNVREHSAD